MATYSLSTLHSFVAVFYSEPYWIGIDVHKRSYHLALLRAVGKTFTLVVPALPEKFVALIDTLGIEVAGVAYETGPTGFILARALQSAQIPVVVAAPSKISRSIRTGSKTDRLDCLKWHSMSLKA